jgi:hypothetical protein
VRGRIRALEAGGPRTDPADVAPSTETAATTSTTTDTGSSGPPPEGTALTVTGGLVFLGTIGPALWAVNRADAVAECEARGCSNGSTLAVSGTLRSACRSRWG